MTTTKLLPPTGNIFHATRLLALLSVDALSLFVEDIRLPVIRASLSGLQTACRAFLSDCIAYNNRNDGIADHDPVLDSAGSHPQEDPLRQALYRTQHTIDDALGAERDVFWAWYGQVVGVPNTPLFEALDQAFKCIPDPPDASANTLPPHLKDHARLLMHLNWLHDGPITGITRVVDDITAQPMSEPDALALEVYWPSFERRPGEDLLYPHEQIIDIAQFWQYLRALARLRMLLPPPLHQDLYSWVATAHPRHMLEVAEVEAALARVSP